MKTLVKRVAEVAMFALIVSVSALAGMTNCLMYISSGGDDRPLTGYLVGESTRSSTTTKSYVSSWSYKFFGGTYSYSTTLTETYNLGQYQMSDGTIQQIRCDTYQKV